MMWLTRSWHRGHRARLALLAIPVVIASLAGCAGGATTAPAASSGADQGTLWAQRPVVRLAFDVAADLRSVTGQES
ncbi:MAG: hypothetical protein J2P19_07855, partial [Pseudonocardia sp.]|nr:hypothetical protein [Pseudonocardia sp.]